MAPGIVLGANNRHTNPTYHPDDLPDAYLDVAAVKKHLGNRQAQAKSPADKAVLKFIGTHEQLHRNHILKKTPAEAYTKQMDTLANGFLTEHGDWAHNASPLYRQFYEDVNAYPRGTLAS